MLFQRINDTMNHTDNNLATVATATPIVVMKDETKLEYVSDIVLGLAFLIIGIIAARRYVFAYFGRDKLPTLIHAEFIACVQIRSSSIPIPSRPLPALFSRSIFT